MSRAAKIKPRPMVLHLPQTVDECHGLIQQLLETQRLLLDRLDDLEERLSLDSSNSSKPPSSDGPGGGSSQPGKPKSGRQRGAQPGHKGSHRKMLVPEELDAVVDCAAPTRCACGGEMTPQGKPLRHQVYELPEIRPVVTEYRRYGAQCACCGAHCHGDLPLGAPSGQLGPHALALIGTLAGQFHLSQGKIRDFMAQVMAMPFSVGTISQAHGKVADALAPVCEEIHAALLDEKVKHADETMHQSHGHKMWLWALVSAWGAHFRIDPSRGKLAAKNLLGETLTGVLVSDRYAAYAWVDDAQRQLCWAHLIRDFRRIGMRRGKPGTIGRSLYRMGLLLFRYRDRDRPPADFEPLRQRIRRLLARGAAQRVCDKTANTCGNLLKQWEALWRFLEDSEIPPTNNHAERALRGVVLRRKISYVTRSGRGLRFVERVFAVAYACRQQGKALFGFLREALENTLHARTLPSLVPGG